jgi:hypothetical protein
MTPARVAEERGRVKFGELLASLKPDEVRSAIALKLPAL